MRTLLLVLTLALALAQALVPGAARAHAMLASATPRGGESVAAVPAELVLRFTEAVEPGFSTITVQDASGARVDRDNVHPGPQGGKSLAIGLNALAPGDYTVVWRVLSVDTHRTEGRFRFTVAPR